MKKTWVYVLTGLLLCVLPISAGGQQIQGQTINVDNIQQLSQLPADTMTPENIRQLPPDVQERIRQEQAKQRQDERNKLKEDSDLSESDLEENDIGKDDLHRKAKASVIEAQDTTSVIEAQDTTSVIEAQYRKGYASHLSSSLTQFGYDVFSSASIQNTSLAVPDPDYVLGTGDQLVIRVWGSEIDTEFTATVGREGTINAPRIGIIQVAGIRYGDIEAVIRKETEKYVHGINLSVILTRLRSIEIFVVGAVRNPGLHVVPAFSTVFDGLLRAGGVKKSGSLRQIRLNRANKTVNTFDLYDLLLHGEPGSNEVLANKDIIFVPGIGKTAAIAGGILNEGIFELTREKNIQDLVKMAGGVLPQASGSRIYLRRFENNQNFIIHDIHAESMAEWVQYPIKTGDLVEVTFSTFSSSQLPNVVRLQGHVWAEDVFRYEQSMRLSDVLTGPAQLMPDAVTDFALIHRYDLDTTRIIPMQFPLSKVFTGQFDAPLHPYDRIQVLSRAGVGMKETFAVTGAVWNPGEFDFQPGLRLKDALALAGGLKFGARTEKIEVARQVVRKDRVFTEYLLLDSESDKDFLLQSSDAVLVPLIKDASHIAKVSITGEVAYPGTYATREGEKISELIRRAGGLSEYAYFYGAKYTSEEARVIQQKSIDQMMQKLRISLFQATATESQTAVSEEALETAQFAKETSEVLLRQLSSIRAEGRVSFKLADLASFENSLFDFRLKDGDGLHIPKKPAFVSVVGSVYSPGSFLYEPNKTLDHYLAKSGGASKTADKKYIYLLKANGEILSMQQHKGFFSHFGKTVLMPGDTIVVPENLERIPYMRLAKDIADIVFKIATTAGVAFAVAL
ncbi:MAG: SLBB domain-containing protein [Desulfotignum sp.]|nr:SLBB domain-containing protein [Desulfotignum sp.]MCF8086660.1 SLBB domain-containing protein [Desulfotignum sp.]